MRATGRGEAIRDANPLAAFAGLFYCSDMPTNHRDRTGLAPRRLRALTVLVALYALVLQGLLGAIAALPAMGAPGLLCAASADGTGKASDGGAAPGARPSSCCPAAGHGSSAAPPPAPGSALAWTEPDATAAAWRGRPLGAVPMSPFRPASARAPPLA